MCSAVGDHEIERYDGLGDCDFVFSLLMEGVKLRDAMRSCERVRFSVAVGERDDVISSLKLREGDHENVISSVNDSDAVRLSVSVLVSCVALGNDTVRTSDGVVVKSSDNDGDALVGVILRVGDRPTE